MSTSKNFSVICNEFCESKVEPNICAICKCHHKLHFPENLLPTNKVHNPPTCPPPPPQLPAQPPVLQYEKVILRESTQENENSKRMRKTYTTDQKCQLNSFGEKLEWTLNEHDNVEIDDFCATLGINRVMLRKWFNQYKPKEN